MGTELIRKVIRRAYVNKLRSGKSPSWRSITGLIDKICFEGIDTKDDDAVDEAYRRSLKLINRVQGSWFKPYFVKEDYEGFLDLGLRRSILGFIINDTIDLVLFNEKDVVVCQVTELADNLSPLYNDIRLRGQAWLLAQEIGKYPTQLRRIMWQPTDKIKIETVNIIKPEEFYDKTQKAIGHIVDAIKYKTFYPSINEQCKTCPFRKKCSF